MDIIKAIEIFALLTGVPYIVFEVMQKNIMWYFGIATGIACAISFGIQHVWASMGLNIYYVFMSLWGLYQWKKDAKVLAASGKSEKKVLEIHLNRLTAGTALWSLAIFIVGSAALIGLLKLLGGNESVMDATVTVSSAIAMFWLAKSYPQHWFIWIVADLVLIALCISSGLYWMALQYSAYVASSVVGLFLWHRKGVYVSE